MRPTVPASRRTFLTTGAAAVAATATPRALAQWQPSPRYPDPSLKVIDPSFARYVLSLAKVERLATGFRWAEGPVWFGDGRYLLWSDIPNDRILRWEEETGAVSVFRRPSHNANGNTRDRQGRLVTCEHDTRRVTRTEHDGTITVVAERYEGKPLNSLGRVDLVHGPSLRHPRLLRGPPRHAGAADERVPRRPAGRPADRCRRRCRPAERPRLLPR
jgi:gluconolactonase